MFLFLTVVACKSEDKVDGSIVSEDLTDSDGDGFGGNDDCDNDNLAIHSYSSGVNNAGGNTCTQSITCR